MPCRHLSSGYCKSVSCLHLHSSVHLSSWSQNLWNCDRRCFDSLNLPRCMTVYDSFRGHFGRQGGADLHFCSPQPDTSLHTVRDCGYGTSTSRAVTVYTPAFAGTKLYCLTSGAHGVNNLPRVVTLPHTGRGLNSRPLDCKFDAMRLHHHATRTWCTEQYLVVIREMNGTVSSVSNWNQMHVQILISTVLNWWQ